MFPARINFRWDGDIHGNHGFGWEWIFVRGRGYVSMLGGLCEDWCDVVMYCVFSIIQISCDEPPTISMKWGL